MERGGRGRGRGERGNRNAQEPQVHVTNRGSNWTLPETLKLLNATREIQLKVNRHDIKFSATEWLQVLEAFRKTGDFAHRKVETIKNRLKVLRQDFTMIKELLGRSGWGWDPERNSVVAPSLDAWDDIFKENKKWKNLPQRTFPWYEQFRDIIGNSSTTGEFGQSSCIGQQSHTGSSDGAQEYDDVPQDSDERERFDFEEIRAVMEEDSVQQPVPVAYVPNPSPATTETGGTSSTRSRGSNKRKSSGSTEQARSQRAKKSITSSQQNQQEMLLEVREIAKNSSRLAAVGEEFVGLQRKKTEVPAEVMAALSELVFNGDDLAVAMRTLHQPIEQQIFMFGGPEQKIAYLNKVIPSFMARNYPAGGQAPQYNPFVPSGAFGAHPF